MSWEVLKKYIRGRCSEYELRQLGAWLQEDPANEDFFKTFIEYWGQDEQSGFEADARAAWQQFKKRSDFPLSSRPQPVKSAFVEKKEPGYVNHRRNLRKWGYLYWHSTAAAAVILIVGLFFYARHWTGTGSRTGNAEIAAQEITTSKGQRTNFKLSDGSRVTLNAESRLKIPEDYGETSRMVYLDGEAFFVVQHDEDHPFVVIASRGYVKDLGTQFNVKAYDSGKIEVAVKEGLASLGEVKEGKLQNELVELTPDKLGVLREAGELTVSDITDIDLFTGWAEGKLVFRETPFPEVLQRLERWFNIECIIKDPQLTERTLTATYSDMAMNEVLGVLSASVRVTYERDNRTITFRDNSKG